MPFGGGIRAVEHHSESMEAIWGHVPGLKVVIPSTPYDAKGLLIAAIRDDNPVVFLEQKLLYRRKGPVPEEEYQVPLARADVKREGSDLTIVTYGRMVWVCLEVASRKALKGTNIEVLDARTLLPLDKQTIINSVKKTGRALIVHEAVQTGGVGGEIAAVIADSAAFFYLDAPIRRLGGLDVPVPYSPELEQKIVPTIETVTREVEQLIQ